MFDVLRTSVKGDIVDSIASILVFELCGFGLLKLTFERGNTKIKC
jgi:hypothetical protein